MTRQGAEIRLFADFMKPEVYLPETGNGSSEVFQYPEKHKWVEFGGVISTFDDFGFYIILPKSAISVFHI